MLGRLKQNLVCSRTQRPHKRLIQTYLLVAWVSSGLLQGQGLWLQQTREAWCIISVLLEEVAISPTIEPLSRWPTNWRTIIPKKFSLCCKILGPTTDFSTLRSGKGTGKPQGIWIWRPVGYYYRTFTGLGKQTVKGHKQNLACNRTQEKAVVTPQETEPDLPGLPHKLAK